MKIVSYNINGLRASMKLGLDKFIKENDFDVLCFQEVRAGEEIARNFFETSQTSIFDDELSQQKDDFSSKNDVTPVLPSSGHIRRKNDKFVAFSR